jgi:hypothetical protein
MKQGFRRKEVVALVLLVALDFLGAERFARKIDDSDDCDKDRA